MLCIQLMETDTLSVSITISKFIFSFISWCLFLHLLGETIGSHNDKCIVKLILTRDKLLFHRHTSSFHEDLSLVIVWSSPKGFLRSFINKNYLSLELSSEELFTEPTISFSVVMVVEYIRQSF